MRDPVIYRINHMHHHPAGGINGVSTPMYDFAHPIEDALEGITHSLCSLEFEEITAPLYDWVIQHCDLPSKPRQIRVRPLLGINHTVMSKAQSSASWWRRAGSPAGTTRGCPPCAACAAGGYTPPLHPQFLRAQRL